MNEQVEYFGDILILFTKTVAKIVIKFFAKTHRVAHFYLLNILSFRLTICVKFR